MQSNVFRPLLSVVLALSAVAFAPFAAGADEPQSSRSISEQVRVSLRLIDVVATDKKGNPLLGLGPEDFTVLIGGKERAIKTFDAAVQVSPGAVAVEPDEPEARRVEAVEPVPEVERPSRWIVILLDADRMPHIYRKVVLKTARAMVEDAGGPGDKFAIALLRDGNLQYLQQFAPADQVDLSVLNDPGQLISRANDLRARVSELVGLIKDCGEQSFIDGCVMTRSEEFLNGIRSENASGFAALSSLISSLYPLPGRKALLWFSGGFVLRPGDVVREIATRYVGDTPTLSSRLESRDRPYMEELIGQASHAQVSFFALRAGQDFSHVMRGADTPTLEQPIDRQAGNPFKRASNMAEEVLRDLANSTGGKAIMTPLMPKLADGLLDRLDGVYTLGIAVEPGDRPGDRLRIKLNRKQSEVQVRRRVPLRGPPPLQLSATLRAVHSEAQGQLAVLLSVELDRVKTEKDRDSGVNTSRLACYARLRDANGNVLDESYRIFEVLRGDDELRRFTESLFFSEQPGGHTVEVTVSDMLGGGSTSVVTPIGTDTASAGR